MKKNTRTFDPVKKMSNQNSYKEKFQGGGGVLEEFHVDSLLFKCPLNVSFAIVLT